jgi:hypothetical protein
LVYLKIFIFLHTNFIVQTFVDSRYEIIVTQDIQILDPFPVGFFSLITY